VSEFTLEEAKAEKSVVEEELFTLQAQTKKLDQEKKEFQSHIEKLEGIISALSTEETDRGEDTLSSNEAQTLRRSLAETKAKLDASLLTLQRMEKKDRDVRVPSSSMFLLLSGLSIYFHLCFHHVSRNSFSFLPCYLSLPFSLAPSFYLSHYLSLFSNPFPIRPLPMLLLIPLSNNLTSTGCSQTTQRNS